MTLSTNSELKAAIGAITVPGLAHSLANVAKVSEIEIDGATASIVVELGFPGNGLKPELESLIRDVAVASGGIDTVQIEWRQAIVSHGVQRNLQPIKGVRNIIAIASGKGGVGKSTTAVNLALALVAEGARVGVLDADIYGPSQPTMLGLAGLHPASNDGKTMDPLEAHGVQVMSIGFLIDVDQPMVWRGPMVTQALSQLMLQTNWSDLDYLIVDMPPGTGDIQLTLSQQVPVSGAVIITTPQDIALLDARKGLQMFRKVSVPVLGVIENMSTHICTECGHEEALFGTGGGQQLSTDYDVELLGQLPLDVNIRQQTDSGKPTVISDPDGVVAQVYRQIARRMTALLATTAKDYSHRFPKIVVEEN